MFSLARTTTSGRASLLRLCAVLYVSICARARGVRARHRQGGVRTIGSAWPLWTGLAKPTTDQNLYIIHQAVDGNRVRRDQFSSPTNRQSSLLIDRASSARPNELTMSGLLADKRHNVVLRLDGKRNRVMELAQEGGATLVTGGRFTSGNAERPGSTSASAPMPTSCPVFSRPTVSMPTSRHPRSGAKAPIPIPFHAARSSSSCTRATKANSTRSPAIR